MNKLKPTDKAACEMVENFCDYFIALKAKYDIYEELFENDKTKLLMEKTARAFFLDYFNEIIVNYLLLEFAKITDRECSNNGKRENFTVDNLINIIDWPDNIKGRLEELKSKTKSFHSSIETARNRLLAHYDKESFLNKIVLGTFTSDDEGVKFIETLQEICVLTHEACFGSNGGEIGVYLPGDVQELEKVLKKALVYDRLVFEGNIEENTRLLKYLGELE
jgi:hypothetical protein